jgi:hypothetical protein
MQTMRVQRVDFAATEDPYTTSDRFAFVVGPSVSVWDTHRLDTPIRVDKVGVLYTPVRHPANRCLGSTGSEFCSSMA